MITRTLLVSSVIAVAGLGLIGVGSNAVFTQNTVSSQQITAGAMKVVIYEGNNEPANAGANVVMAAVGPTNSTFTTGDKKVTIHNVGNIDVQEIKLTPATNTTGGSNPETLALAAQVSLCMVSLNSSNVGVVIYNGLLSGFAAQDIQGTLLANNGTDYYSVNYYAGTVTTACGAVTTVNATAVSGNSTAPSLTDPAQGGVITPTITVGYSG